MNLDNKILLENSINGKIIEERFGASGVIYIVDNGENTSPRKVAYKSIRVDKLNVIKKQHFLIECDLWFKSSNSYLTTAFYPIIVDDLPYICMPYYELDLKNLMLNKSFNKIEALVIACQLSKALWVMEKNGIKYHQDFNPPNVLIDDLSKKFRDYPTDNCINYSIKITDLGIADLIKKIGPTIGGGGGKFPFKAPEQYETKKYKSYNPDIFALGVMTYMLLTDKHPNGLNKTKALNKNTSSSKFKKWAFDAKISLDNNVLEKAINSTLQEIPSKRPNAEEIHNILMSELSITDNEIYNKLEHRFEYFDNNDHFDPLAKELHTLKKLAKFTHNKELIYQKVEKTSQKMFSRISSENELIKICEYFSLLIFLSDKGKNVSLLLKMSKKLIAILSKWYSKIKVHHKYPQNTFKGITTIKTPDYRDIEITSSYISVICNVLDLHLSKKQIEEIFKGFKDDIFYSIYLYSRATSIRNLDIYKCIEILEKAKELNKNEPLFDYMKYLWITHNGILNKNKELDEIKNKSYSELKKYHLDWETIKKL